MTNNHHGEGIFDSCGRGFGIGQGYFLSENQMSIDDILFQLGEGLNYAFAFTK